MAFFPIPWYLVIALGVLVIIFTTLGALSGFSGSVFIVPLFSLILFAYNIPFMTIIGCSAAGCFFNGLLATIINIRRKEIDWILALIFEIPTTAGVLLGAFLTTRIDERITTSIFTAFAVILATSLFVRLYNRRRRCLNDADLYTPCEVIPEPLRRKKVRTLDQKELSNPTKRLVKASQAKQKTITKPDDSRVLQKTVNSVESAKKATIPKETKRIKRKPFLARVASYGPKWKINKESYSYTVNILILIVVALSIGFLAGMVGCGGGWVKAPVLISAFGVPPTISVSTSMLMTTITLLISGSTHIILGHFALWLWIIIVSGSVIGSLLGSTLKKHFSSNLLQLVMAFTLSAIAVVLLVKTWLGF
jgi:uncharacterized membrane protein YfcA